jgi:hypothetical protein
MAIDDGLAIWVETGGDLSKDRTLFRFGKRVETLHLTNNTSTTRLFDVQVARDPTFYWPSSPFNAQAARREITKETYFYVTIASGGSYDSKPFFARRGLKVKAQGANGRQCTVDALVAGVQEGEITVKDIG